MKGGDDINRSFMKHLYIFLPDFDNMWNNKQQLFWK
jgi:hypothetical protein